MLELKIGRHTYKITEDDEFLDNHSCVQLLTQSKERISWGHRPTPCLSKKAIKEISAFDRLQKTHNYGNRCELFTLKLK